MRHDKWLPYVTKPFKGDFKITSGFGDVNKKLRGGRVHKGVDYGMPVGTPLLSCFDGRILVQRGMYFRGDGKKVKKPYAAGNRILVFSYPRDLIACYFHMDRFAYEPEPGGRKVKAGELIGWSGNTGHSTGPHLHFELRRISDGKSLRPYFQDEYTLEEVVKGAPYEIPAVV